MTHYLPSKLCITDKYKYNILNKFYYSNCDDLVKKAKIWCAGHTHDGHHIVNIDKTPICMNPLGYLWEHTDYKKDFVFEI